MLKMLTKKVENFFKKINFLEETVKLKNSQNNKQ